MVVVDSSAMVQALLRTGRARDRLSDDELHAPHLLDSEVTNALRGLLLGRRLDAERAERALGGLQRAGVTRYPALDLTSRVWLLRADLTAYDALYVALAEKLGCALVTTDARIARAAGPRCVIEVVD